MLHILRGCGAHSGCLLYLFIYYRYAEIDLGFCKIVAGPNAAVVHTPFLNIGRHFLTFAVRYHRSCTSCAFQHPQGYVAVGIRGTCDSKHCVRGVVTDI